MESGRLPSVDPQRPGAAITSQWSRLECFRLSQDDLLRLARADIRPGVIEQFRACLLLKNAIVFEAIRRAVLATGDAESKRLISVIAGVLAEVESRQPGIAARTLITPQFSSWAADCHRQLRTLEGTRLQVAALLGPAASYAASAAIQAGCPVDIAVPVRDGGVWLPSVGLLRVESGGWARVTRRSGELSISSGDAVVILPQASAAPAGAAAEAWRAAPKLTATTAGITIGLDIDVRDPFMARFRAPATDFSPAARENWRRSLARAWRLIVIRQPELARAMAAGLSVLIPLAEANDGRPLSMTSGWAWGAIALSLMTDPLLLAETLVHEFCHLVLSAVDELVPLTAGHEAGLYYTPWRDDPRPLPEMLQGCYAHLGMAGFWRQQYLAGQPGSRRRCAVEFARRTAAAADAVGDVTGSAQLTPAGTVFATHMSAVLTGWAREPLARRARLVASELRLEHRVRWRLAHLRPNEAFIERLAARWLDSRDAGLADLESPPAVVAVRDDNLPPTRSRLLELRYRDLRRFRRAIRRDPALDEADVAFATGRNSLARRLYLRRIDTSTDYDAWAGLIAVASRSPATPGRDLLLGEPELVAGLHQRLRAVSGRSYGPEELAAWLHGVLTAGSGA